MNLDQIKANASEGSTHWDVQWNHVFYYQVDTSIKMWNEVKFVFLDFTYNLSMYELKPLWLRGSRYSI
ncbi:MAG: hypothetical protein GAK29_01463 [Acinetobacter bereziniae]|uniref:Uncharacterized protein n=1 Tax=Acinetobacter bereziniae TaxID=106648 RepID=A0A833US57_ACIBZ|nr:MAG: hypothetical protein GAK29_01463 [Acinetobacter bereziniae]